MLWLDSLGLPAVLPPREEEKPEERRTSRRPSAQPGRNRSARACSRRGVPR